MPARSGRICTSCHGGPNIARTASLALKPSSITRAVGPAVSFFCLHQAGVELQAGFSGEERHVGLVVAHLSLQSRRASAASGGFETSRSENAGAKAEARSQATKSTRARSLLAHFSRQRPGRERRCLWPELWRALG